MSSTTRSTDDPIVVTTDDPLVVITTEVTPEVPEVDDVPTLLADVVGQIGADDMWAAGFTGAGVDVLSSTLGSHL